MKAKHRTLKSTSVASSAGTFVLDADGCTADDLTPEQVAYFGQFVGEWEIVGAPVEGESDPVVEPPAQPAPVEPPPESVAPAPVEPEPATPDVEPADADAAPVEGEPDPVVEPPAVQAWCEREDLARLVNAWNKAKGGEYDVLRGKKGRELAVDFILALDDATRAQILEGKA